MSVREQAGDSSGGNGRRRRRHWSAVEKRRIVAEADAPGASVSVVARRYDLNANMLVHLPEQAIVLKSQILWRPQGY